MDSKKQEILIDYIEARNINDLVASIYDLPNWMERGLKLVYQERVEAFLKFLLDKAKNGSGIYVQNALDVMEALDNGATFEEADKLLEDYGNFSKEITRSFVLEWSKRGPQYYKETLEFPIEELTPDVLYQIGVFEKANAQYEKNALLRENKKKNNRAK